MTSIEGFKSSPYITLEEITNALEKFDPTEDGKVPYKSLKIVMRDLGLDPRESEVAKSIETLKINGKHADRLSKFYIINFEMKILQRISLLKACSNC